MRLHHLNYYGQGGSLKFRFYLKFQMIIKISKFYYVFMGINNDRPE